MNKKIIGIDLGTTNSCVAYYDGDQILIIENSEGKRTTPSVVSYDDKGKAIIGEQARRASVNNVSRVVYEIKRFMGKEYGKDLKSIIKNYNSGKDTSSQLKDAFPYAITETKHHGFGIRINNEVLTPEQISSQILQSLKKDAEMRLGCKIEEAVITVPAYFNNAEREATKNAAKIAGLKVERLLNEPTAAALAYGLDKKLNQKILVFDLGGGTFDVSILESSPSENVLEVLTTTGDTLLGGSDFDQLIVDHIKKTFYDTYRKNLLDCPKKPQELSQLLQRIREAAEDAKKSLSALERVDITLPFITADINFETTLTRFQFETLSSGLIQRCFSCMDDALKKADLTKKDIDEVLLVGGMTRMPIISQEIKKRFGKEANKTINPDEVVAAGAAILGYTMGTKDGKNTAGVPLLLDVTPLSLGIETLGGVMTPLIPANTTIPTRRENVFSTADDNQNAVTIRVFQGERPLAKDNKLLGSFELSGIPSAARGVPQIEVSFDMDVSGLLTVTAKDKGTGKIQKISITEGGGLTKEEIEKMRRDAESNRENDSKKLEFITTRNEISSAITHAKKTLKENESIIPEELKQELEKVEKEAEVALEDEEVSIETLKSVFENFKTVSMKMGQIIYDSKAQTETPEPEKEN